MIGKDAFCPTSGASLSRESHYDEQGRPSRAVEADESAVAAGTVGELTNGAVRSSQTALLRYFERCHARHADRDASLYRSASLALRRLKSVADGRQEWDVHVWYALKHRLGEKGYDVEWMDSHAQLWCPHCHSRLRYAADGLGELQAWCGVDCTGRPAECLTDIREIVATLYRATFDEEPSPDAEEFLRA